MSNSPSLRAVPSRLARRLLAISACASLLIAPGLFARSIDYDLATLLGNNGFRTFTTAGETMGRRIANLGDINGDGFADFATSGINNSGLIDANVFVIFGKAGVGGTGLFDFLTATSATALRIVGPNGEDFGSSIAGIGDINGDGKDDFAIGSPLADLPGKTDAGRAYVILGAASYGASKTVNLSTVIATSGFTIKGANAQDRFGSSVGGGGDVNGDGFDDLVICSSEATAAGKALAGVAQVIFGGNTFVPNSILDAGNFTTANSIKVLGPAANAVLGRSCCVAGDMNGDGLAEVAIGAPTNDPGSFPGGVYVVFGQGGGVIDTSLPLAGSGFSVSGALNGDQLGYSLAALGDFNGDGRSDLAMGLPGSDGPVNNAGRIDIVYGSPTLGVTGFVFVQSLTGANGVRIVGNIADDDIAHHVGRAGDVNGDGFDDVVFAAENSDPLGLANAGMAYLVFGGTDIGNGGEFSTGSIDGTTTGVRFPGVKAQNGMTGVAGGGDVNGDGRPDLLLASFGAKDPPGGHTGEVYVILDLVPAPLSADYDVIHASTGGVQTMAVTAGAQYGGKYYYMLGSMTGTTPGTPFGGFTMPLVADAYFQFMLSYPNLLVANSVGLLDANGKGEAAIFVPTGLPPELQVLTLQHAYFVYDQTKGKVKFVSNAVQLRILP